ncbi:MAG TPA: phytanoyl-CoA dioxygenase family protein [Acidimicrobiales bacterium]
MAVQQLPAPTRDLAQANRDMAEHGYALIADALSASQCEAMKERLIEQALAEGPLKGQERSMDDPHLRYDVGALLNKGSIFLEVIDPDSLAHQVVGDTLAPAIAPELAALYGLEQRFLVSGLDGTLKRLEVATSGAETTQAHLNPIFHVDQAMVPKWLDYPVAVNCFYCLTEYTEANGATLIVPGTHLTAPPAWGQYSGDGAIPIEAPAGTAILVDGRTWHAAGINTNGELRASVTAYCAAPWIRQRWPMSMNMRDDVVAQLSRGQLLMCGFDTMFQSEYGSFAGPGIIEPTLGRNNVTVPQQSIGELHLT